MRELEDAARAEAEWLAEDEAEGAEGEEDADDEGDESDESSEGEGESEEGEEDTPRPPKRARAEPTRFHGEKIRGSYDASKLGKKRKYTSNLPSLVVTEDRLLVVTEDNQASSAGRKSSAAPWRTPEEADKTMPEDCSRPIDRSTSVSSHKQSAVACNFWFGFERLLVIAADERQRKRHDRKEGRETQGRAARGG